MHGYYQGYPVIEDLIAEYEPDVLLLQEHWLTPANLCKFNDQFSNYYYVGTSAMSRCVEQGMLRGRPYGGVITLIKKSLQDMVRTVQCDERYVIVKVADLILVNVYLPCAGSKDRLLICDDILVDLWSWREHFADCQIVIAGDFNVCLDNEKDACCKAINCFLRRHSLIRCDDLFPDQKTATYVNYALNLQSQIDYIITSLNHNVVKFAVLDPDINFSDHLPLLATFSCPLIYRNNSGNHEIGASRSQRLLRWDHADLMSYYHYTGEQLAPLLTKIDDVLSHQEDSSLSGSDNCPFIDLIYDDIACILQTSAKKFVPEHRKNFYKFWWNEEMSALKEASIEANRVWKAAGKPKQGAIFHKRQASRAQYRKCIREHKNVAALSYTNDLHDALLRKNGVTFWKCWRSKFESINKCREVEGYANPNIVSLMFANHFSRTFSGNNASRVNMLKQEYMALRANYSGFPLIDEVDFDTELVSRVILGLKFGKATDIDGLSAEHLIYSHPILSVILSKMFRLILMSHHIPTQFKNSYMVPIPKGNNYMTKPMTCDDFRAIAISPILSKVFEYSFLDRFGKYLGSADNQFGFKKGVGCSHAIYTCRNIVDRFVQNGSTVNICAIDLSKAFDKVNHHALFIKLMEKHVPVIILDLLENLLSCCTSCVKWENSWSDNFEINFGVRQGSVLSPLLFALYIDDLANLHCPERGWFILLYAGNKTQSI